MKKVAKKYSKDEINNEFFKFFNSNKKTIRDYKNYHLKMQRYILSNKDFMIKPTSVEEFKQREEDVKDLELSIDALYLVKVAEEYKKENQMIHCRFKLYKNGKMLIIANTYETPGGKKKFEKTFHYMPNGFPLKHRKRELKYRNKFEISEDFKLIDEGNFRQVFDNIKGSKISYKGRKYNFRIKYRSYGKGKKHYWIEMMRFEKIKTKYKTPSTYSSFQAKIIN